MSLTTITAYAATPLYDRPPQRRRAWNAPDGRSSSEASPAAQAAALLDAEAVPAPSFEAASYVPHVFRADLTAIASQYDPAESGETDAHEPDFLSAFSALLATVMSGDTRGAQAAARNLQQQIGRAETGADDTRAPGAIGRFFEDLQALIRTARPIAEIALSLGYCDQSAFTQQFRRNTGQTPHRFRSRHTVKAADAARAPLL